MISIFNGRSRSLGETSRKEVYLQLEVAFRRYLHHFKGAQLSVFLSIGLHIDELGWSWPKVSTICKESGYGDNIVHKALNNLCTLKIRGRRVMLRAKKAPDHYVPNPKEKKYARNFYLIFPDDAEIAKYEGEDSEGAEDPNHLRKTIPKKRESLFLGTKKVDMVFERRSLNTKEEPSIKKNQEEAEPETHTQPEPVLPLIAAAEAQDVVRVSSDLIFEDYLAYARSKTSFHTPDAWARVHFALRDPADDFLVREWKASQQPEAIAEARSTPENKNLFFDEAAAVLRSILSVRPDCDVRAEIDGMPLDEDVRARLLAQFVTPPAEG